VIYQYHTVMSARGRRWLDELLADANANAESTAKRERCSIRKVNMTISLAWRPIW
jgi:site-specific DNA recombinase